MGEGDEPADYTVRLYFAELEDVKVGSRVFDVKLQGKTVLAAFDLPKEAQGSHKAVVREFREVRITRNLDIELVPNPGAPGPILSGVEIIAPVSFARR